MKNIATYRFLLFLLLAIFLIGIPIGSPAIAAEITTRQIEPVAPVEPSSQSVGELALQPGETIEKIYPPDPTNYIVIVGTSFTNIPLQSTIQVVYNTVVTDPDTGEPIQETRAEAITWQPGDYDSDVDGTYTLTATFDDPSLVGQAIEPVTVEVIGKALAEIIRALPLPVDAADLTAAEKIALRSHLIDINNKLNELRPSDKAGLEAYLGIEEMAKFAELYELYVMADGGPADSLSGDWAYISRFEIIAIHDGTGPFDTSSIPTSPDYMDRQGNDANDSNKLLRTFDTISYDLSYSTAVSGEYAGIKNGYMYYEFVSPYPIDQAQWELTGMTWIGIPVTSFAALAAKADGENYYLLETKTVNGVLSQVLTGKRYLVPTAPNPSAFPGSGTLNSVLRVLNKENGSTLQPSFTVWLEHNHLDGECPIHERTEPKHVIADPVVITSELRLNVQIKPVATSYVNGVDDFDFSTGNTLAANKTAGIVTGRITGYGLTVQAYNLDPNDGMKGVAFPSGPITFDIKLEAVYKTATTSYDLTGDPKYGPLVWSYEANQASVNQLDGRNVVTYNPVRYGVSAAPAGTKSGSFPDLRASTPLTGAVVVWNGGNWVGQQASNIFSLTVDSYSVNPNWFPNADMGNSTNTPMYFNPALGVRSAAIGGLNAAEFYVIAPFGNGDDYLPIAKGEVGTIELAVSDINLRATSQAGGLAVVADNSNQTKLTDDRLVRTVFLSQPGTYTNRISYIASTTLDPNAGINGTTEHYADGQDTAARGQAFGIVWGGTYDPNGEKANAVYGLNALMKFDPNGLEIIGNAGIHTRQGYLDSTTTATFLYAVKPDGSTWLNDDEMHNTIESGLNYYKTLDEARTHGIVVGVLAEFRNTNPRVALTQVFASIPVRAKLDAPTDAVYQVIERTKVWRQAEFNAAGGVIPRRYDVGDSIVYPNTVAGLNDFFHTKYVKAYYISGVYSGGHLGTFNF